MEPAQNSVVRCLADVEQLNFKHQGSPAGNIRRFALDAIGLPVGHDQGALFTFAHGEECFVPPGDHLADTDPECKGRTFLVRTVEDLAAKNPAFIINQEFLSDGGQLTFARAPRHIHQAGWLGVPPGVFLGHQHRVFPTQFGDAVVFHGQPHRAVDRSTGICPGKYARAHDEREREQAETNQDDDEKITHEEIAP